MSELAQNLIQIKSRIQHYCEASQRAPESVELVAVGKRHGVAKIVTFARCGQRHFGENYLQEALQKMRQIDAMAQQFDALQWHFIGHIQSKKCRQIAEHFDWVDSIESLKMARLLNQYSGGRLLNVLIQVNIDQQQSKSGVAVSELPGLANEIAKLPNLNLRGLMVIPKPRDDAQQQREVFAQCRALFERLNATGLRLDQLSMGMTQDMQAAIAEGATQVRIGTALFGARAPK